jgi:hypothetical protein
MAQQRKARFFQHRRNKMKLLHDDAKILAEVLSRVEVGEIIEWADISKAIGIECKAHGPGYVRLMSARRHLLNESRMVFAAIKGVGLQRCNDQQTVSVVESSVRSMHRKAGKTLKVVSTVSEDKLTNEEKQKLFALSAQAGVVRQFAGKTATKRLSDTQKEPARISFADTLKMFNG